jgi:hypothetical protein
MLALAIYEIVAWCSESLAGLAAEPASRQTGEPTCVEPTANFHRPNRGQARRASHRVRLDRLTPTASATSFTVA